MTALPPSCGELGPRIGAGSLPAAPALCVLAVGHAGLHRAVDGMEWRVVPTSSELLEYDRVTGFDEDRVAPTPAELRLGVAGGALIDLATLEPVGFLAAPALAAELAELWNESR